ncbi:hypothetical protein AWB68_07744 [Caballeronia choica]|jgi:hypothetical protein|uniref:Uncharacterized protein n=1 Tax=Caballeronia choica TaxID=326476 RepID=A0A158KY18_9BURK|nr:hypothetical protein AWB68_07744 [Caballeronia choica]
MTNVPAQKKGDAQQIARETWTVWTTLMLLLRATSRSVKAGFARLRKRLLIELPWKRRQGDIARVLQLFDLPTSIH